MSVLDVENRSVNTEYDSSQKHSRMNLFLLQSSNQFINKINLL